VVVDIFAEDLGHGEFLKALVNRLARQEGKVVVPRVRSARGGHGRALDELSLYQRSVQQGVGGMTVPDLLIVAIDTNCLSFNNAKRQVQAKLEAPFDDRTVVACPDPHIERWYLADPESFHHVVGVTPKVGRRKCERDRYKSILSKAVLDAGHPPTLGGIEFAREIVEAMDFYRAGKRETSLKHFLDDATAQIRLR
jgi:hypothetical protein